MSLIIFQIKFPDISLFDIFHEPQQIRPSLHDGRLSLQFHLCLNSEWTYEQTRVTMADIDLKAAYQHRVAGYKSQDIMLWALRDLFSKDSHADESFPSTNKCHTNQHFRECQSAFQGKIRTQHEPNPYEINTGSALGILILLTALPIYTCNPQAP